MYEPVNVVTKLGVEKFGTKLSEMGGISVCFPVRFRGKRFMGKAAMEQRGVKIDTNITKMVENLVRFLCTNLVTPEFGSSNSPPPGILIYKIKARLSEKGRNKKPLGSRSLVLGVYMWEFTLSVFIESNFLVALCMNLKLNA